MDRASLAITLEDEQSAVVLAVDSQSEFVPQELLHLHKLGMSAGTSVLLKICPTQETQSFRPLNCTTLNHIGVGVESFGTVLLAQTGNGRSHCPRKAPVVLVLDLHEESVGLGVLRHPLCEVATFLRGTLSSWSCDVAAAHLHLRVKTQALPALPNIFDELQETLRSKFLAFSVGDADGIVECRVIDLHIDEVVVLDSVAEALVKEFLKDSSATVCTFGALDIFL